MKTYPVGATVEIDKLLSNKLRDIYGASLRLQLDDSFPGSSLNHPLEATLLQEPKLHPQDKIWVYKANITGTNIDIPLRQDEFDVVSFTENLYTGYHKQIKLPSFKSYVEFFT